MDSRAKLYMERSRNKIILAKTTFEISTDIQTKRILGIPSEQTFYNDVISQGYYAIFYAAKAMLESRGIKTKVPNEHQKTYEEFEKIIIEPQTKKRLLEIYESEKDKAESLLQMYFNEKKKRGRFTYNINANANIPYAKESIQNATTFLRIISGLIE